MKVWTNNKFDGHWPVGTAAVVVAETAEDAARILADALRPLMLGSDVTAEQFVELPTDAPMARVLRDGDY